MPNFNGDAVSSLPTRAQSPINLPRGAHPGAVLLSPKRSTLPTTATGGTGTGNSSQLLSPSQHPLSLNDILDQQHQPHRVDSGSTMSLDTSIQQPMAGSGALMSPLLQPQASSLSVRTTFLDSFGSRPSSAMGMQQDPQGGAHNQQSHAKNNIMVNFTNDVNQLCTWMTMLSAAQQNTVMDNLLSSLNEEVLHHTKLKIDSLINSGYLSPTLQPILSPVQHRSTVDNTSANGSTAQLPGALTLDSVLNSNTNGNTASAAIAKAKSGLGASTSAINSLYRQWSPNPQGSSSTQPMFDYLNEITRPRSADLGRLKNSHHQQHHHHHHQAAGNIIGAAINNVGASSVGAGASGYSQNAGQSGSRFSKAKVVRSQSPSSLVRSDSLNSSFTESQSSGLQAVTPVTSNSGTTSTTVASSTSSNMNPKSLCDPKLLKNIPAWLKSLRLHKYSSALSGKTWQDLIQLDDLVLEEMGVSALGARRKLLKAFAIVKEYKDKGLIDESAY